MLKYEYIFFQIKYTEALLSNSTRKLLRFEISKMLIAVLKIDLLCYLLQFSAHFRSLRSRLRSTESPVKTAEPIEMLFRGGYTSDMELGDIL